MPDAVGLGAAGEGEEGPEAEANAGASVAAAEAADGAASGVTLTGRDGAPDCDEAFSCSAPADAGGCQPQLHLEDKAEVVCRWQYLAWLDPFQPPRVHAAADAAPAASESTLECGGSVAVAGVGAGGGAARTPRLVLRKMWSYTGPGLLISVGYMDPGAPSLPAPVWAPHPTRFLPRPSRSGAARTLPHLRRGSLQATGART